MPISSETTILIVDDVPDNLHVLGQLLRGAGYRVRAANSGAAALRLARQKPLPSLVLLDVMMPVMDGYEVLRQLQADTQTEDIPVVFVTALSDPRDEDAGLALGAADYITKPIQPTVVLARVRTQLEAKWARDWLQDRNTLLEAEVERRMAENDEIQSLSIRALASLAEIRDNETGNHILRTQNYVRVLAEHLRENPRFAALRDAHYRDQLVRSAPLHDIGKVGIPDHILLKPGKLTAEEWVIMRTHTTLGARAIERAEQASQRPIDFLVLAKEIALSHHEKWDGSGYPRGLAGDAIPISARLMALADVFDALINKRVYKPAMPVAEACDLIVAGSGTHFDPEVVTAFVACLPAFIDIARRYADDELAAA